MADNLINQKPPSDDDPIARRNAAQAARLARMDEGFARVDEILKQLGRFDVKCKTCADIGYLREDADGTVKRLVPCPDCNAQVAPDAPAYEPLTLSDWYMKHGGAGNAVLDLGDINDE